MCCMAADAEGPDALVHRGAIQRYGLLDGTGGDWHKAFLISEAQQEHVGKERVAEHREGQSLRIKCC